MYVVVSWYLNAFSFIAVLHKGAVARKRRKVAPEEPVVKVAPKPEEKLTDLERIFGRGCIAFRSLWCNINIPLRVEFS